MTSRGSERTWIRTGSSGANGLRQGTLIGFEVIFFSLAVTVRLLEISQECLLCFSIITLMIFKNRAL